ncbi:hypothetical protein [Campylobacter sp. CCUG 57310]|uniref:hypothetical protein n=1 Tax=Campylobacter sp. CCUG 57310 TaxID=2517362 RepID=UPI00156602B1|nr:hypothetical protein [Campylobacter sp. CCUG 57310]QKF93168.1 hypothetical protein CORI_2021 [Campylobacter sp. CCUG 57310]
MKNLTLTLFLAAFVTSAFAASCDNAVVKGIVTGTGKNLPMRMDPITTLTKIECKDGTLKYTYELNDIDNIKLSKFDDAKKKLFFDVQRNIIKNFYCTTLSDIQDYTNSVIWSYRFNGNVFGEFEFRSSDCKK